MPINKPGVKSNTLANTKKWVRKFLSAPAELKAYAIFIVIVTIASIMITFVIKGEILTSYRKYFGATAANGYLYSLYFIFALINFNKRTRPLALRFAMVGMLMFAILFNSWMLFFVRNGAGNIELIWTVLVPVFWVLVLFSPRVNRFCENIVTVK